MSREGQPLLLLLCTGDFWRPGMMIITSDNVISVSPRPTKRRRLGYSMVAVLSFCFLGRHNLFYIVTSKVVALIKVSMSYCLRPSIWSTWWISISFRLILG